MTKRTNARWLRKAGLLAMLGLATACGTPLAQRIGLAQAIDARDLLTPRLLARVKQPYLLVIFDRKDIATTFAVIGENPPVRTWINADQSTLSITRQGLVVRTAGLGRDLVTADTAQTADALRGGTSATVRRVHRLLDGADHAIAVPYACQITPRGAAVITLPTGRFATRLTEELCTDAAGRSFMNSYWTDTATGTLRQSRQWISPEVGSLTLQMLRD